MFDSFEMSIKGWEDGGVIPAKFAFGQPGEGAPFAPAGNVNPEIQWENAPKGTKSFALICVDVDVPSSGDDVNQEGKKVPADLPRGDFYHWVLVDIPASFSGIPEGACSQGITARGKKAGKSEWGIAGLNDYTGWFSGDPDMKGAYGNYDGPCPPWNDSIIHHYHFTLYALNTDSLGLTGEFTGAEALEKMKGHVLGSSSYIGTYAMNPKLRSN